ncbi:MAG TPA: hypothetical protein VEK38_00830 [Candidatus Bathyarchaeia archaeon]|nr:hypothetical protein [Candidatus Bathyarchaeia archaeon]
MKDAIKISYCIPSVSEKNSASSSSALEQTAKIFRTGNEQYLNAHSFIFLPADRAMHKEIKKIGEEKKSLQPALIIIIGIGGSSVGMEAIFHALYGTLYNETHKTPRMYIADATDAPYLYTLYAQAEQILKEGKNIILFVASKSGTTTETVANFALFASLLAQYKKEYAPFIIIATDKNSPLFVHAQKHGYTYLEIPQQVGGRYSVFSPVGLFPLYLCNIDIDELCAGACSITSLCLDTTAPDTNIAATRAAYLYALYMQNYIIHNMFVFGRNMESVGQWYKQLMGESIGKEYDVDKNLVNCGITPLVSVGSNDLHSVAQLYLSGPFNTTTTFVSVDQAAHDIRLPAQSSDILLPSLANISAHTLTTTILHAVKETYEKHKRPFMHIELPSLSPYYLGQLLQMHMIEMVYLATLLQVNPFDQPTVEEYKQRTRELLAKK